MEIDQKKLHIRPALIGEWEPAMELAWRTFLKFEAKDYTREGVRNFEDFITDPNLERMFVVGKYRLFCAFYEEKMVGIISLREKSHISLLFVDARYHCNGIGRQLVARAKYYLQTELGESGMTVNAAPYAVEFYHKMGFVDLKPQETRDGITFTSMIYRF
jgi:GNAT superfamily N-acetyltransferase